MEKLRDRGETSKEDCWDLTKIVKNQEEYDSLITTVKDKNQEIVQMKGHILDSADSLWQYLQASEEEERAFSRLLVYTKLHNDEDTRDSKTKKELLEVQKLGDVLNETESFVITEFMQKDLDDVLGLLEQKEELKEYRLYFERLYFSKERILSEKEEAIIAKAVSAFGTPDDTFTSLDVTDASFRDVMCQGEAKTLNHYNYAIWLENPDQQLRAQAFHNYYEFYRNHRHVFASLLNGNYQELEFMRSIRKYPNALEMALDEIHVKKEVYTNLIESVHKYMGLNIEFQKLKAKLLGNKEYHLYDTYVPVVDIDQKSYSKEEGIDLIKKALAPLGEDYLEHFQRILDEHTVDFYSNEGKENGAYQWGCYDSPSYVLLNFNGTLDSVSTLAHEFGHGVHSMYSRENNIYPYYGYEIFLAEIASTVNECLLSCYNIDHAIDKKEKMFYLCEFLDKVKATIYRQTMFAEAEKIMSEKVQNKESLTDEIITDIYYELNQKYFEDSAILDDDIRYECYRISHFYRPFYVYQYATGLLSAICIVNSILNKKEGFPDKYLAFLKSGCNQNVLDILKIVDVDLTSLEPFTFAFSFIEEKLNELKTLVETGE